MISQRYKITKSPTPAMRWKDYEQYLIRQFNNLLETHGDKEKRFQSFFEENPCMLPGAFSLNLKSGHYPFAGTVIAQPELTGLTSKIPDFMWIACDSGTVYPVLIEIEAPAKKYFTKKGKTTEKFNQAHDQLAE
jgi:hypothetical protein